MQLRDVHYTLSCRHEKTHASLITNRIVLLTVFTSAQNKCWQQRPFQIRFRPGGPLGELTTLLRPPSQMERRHTSAQCLPNLSKNKWT